MEELKLESYEKECPELEKYLSDSITSYGIEQLNGNKPHKLFSCYKNSNEQVMGAIMGYVTFNLFFITHLFVEETHRNNGIGKILLTEIESAALNHGCNILRLNTLNRKAHSFYLDAGFIETTCISNHMNGFDLVYYHKNI